MLVLSVLKNSALKASELVNESTHVIQVNHEGDVAPDGGVQLALPGGQAEATWRPR